MKKIITVLTIGLALSLGLVTTAAAGPGDSGSSFSKTKIYQDWSQIHEKRGGDRFVLVPLSSSKRGYSTEQVAAHGHVEIDMIGGRAQVTLSDLDRAVDVWALDNKPGEGRSIRAEEGDVMIFLGRVEPNESGLSTVTKVVGPEPFKGFELDWVVVAEAGKHPGSSRLLYGVRTYMETVYTRDRLTREGYKVDRAPRTDRPESITLKNGITDKNFATAPDDILVTLGLVSQDAFDGADVFFRQTFEGNGRNCGSCHPAENNQVIEKDFIDDLLISNPNDPLFVAELRPPTDPISDLERPALMKEFGLILENVDGLEDPNNKFLMRGVPHSLSLATSIAAGAGEDVSIFTERTGWSGDGSPAGLTTSSGITTAGRLLDFTLGAIIQHYPNDSLARVFKEDVPQGADFDFRLPTQEELRVSNEYMLTVGRTQDITIANVSLNNTDAETGRVAFQRQTAFCNGCHFNAGANAFFTGGNSNFDTRAEFLPNPAQGFNGINFPLDGGFGGQGLANPNNDCDGDGVNDCFGDLKQNTPPLIEAADTAPFFHNNAAATLEDSIDFYRGAPFFDPNAVPANPRTAASDLTVAEVDQVGAFLRVLNASFNYQLAIQRAEASFDLSQGNAGFNPKDPNILGTSNKILSLAIDEVNDALDVLTSGPLGDLDPTSTSAATTARFRLNQAINTNKMGVRRDRINQALTALNQANNSLGTGMTYTLGEGNLLF